MFARHAIVKQLGPSFVAPGADGDRNRGSLGAARRVTGAGRTYTSASTNGILPAYTMAAMAPGADGALWIGTRGWRGAPR